MFICKHHLALGGDRFEKLGGPWIRDLQFMYFFYLFLPLQIIYFQRAQSMPSFIIRTQDFCLRLVYQSVVTVVYTCRTLVRLMFSLEIYCKNIAEIIINSETLVEGNYFRGVGVEPYNPTSAVCVRHFFVILFTYHARQDRKRKSSVRDGCCSCWSRSSD